MKKLSKALATLIAVAVVISMLSMSFVAYADTVTDTVYSEDFENADFTVTTNAANTVKEVYKDGVATGWTYAKTDGNEFSDFPESVYVHENETSISDSNKSYHNTTWALSTQSYAMDNTNLYMNLPEKITSGKVTIQFRLKRAAKSKEVFFYATEDEITSGAYTGDIVTKVSQATSGSYVVDFNTYYTASDKQGGHLATNYNINQWKGYNLITVEIDLDNHTVTRTANNFKNETTSNRVEHKTEDTPMYNNGGDAHFADGISGFYFTGATAVKIDDVVITHEHEAAPAPLDPVITPDSGEAGEAGTTVVWGTAANVTGTATGTDIEGNDTYTFESESGEAVEFGVQITDGDFAGFYPALGLKEGKFAIKFVGDAASNLLTQLYLKIDGVLQD